MTETVVLTVGSTAYALEVVTMHNSLETLTLRSADDVNESNVLSENVGQGDGVAKLDLAVEVHRELYELVLRGGSCLLEVPHKRRAGLLFFLFAIGKLHSGIAVLFYSANLCDNARTSLNNGAWYIFTISTENGSHSDFLSN